MNRRAAFLDRDGVLNDLVCDPASGRPESPLHVADVRLAPRAAEGARRLAAAGFTLVGITNQPAAAKGTVSLDVLDAIQDRVLELLAAEGIEFADFRRCLHHPDAIVATLRGPCACRKPAPGMLLDAAAALGLELGSSWIFGDTDADVAAGRAAGCRTALITHPGSAHKRFDGVRPDVRGADLQEAAATALRAGV